jgi:hypothetical protein
VRNNRTFMLCPFFPILGSGFPLGVPPPGHNTANSRW